MIQEETERYLNDNDVVTIDIGADLRDAGINIPGGIPIMPRPVDLFETPLLVPPGGGSLGRENTPSFPTGAAVQSNQANVLQGLLDTVDGLSGSSGGGSTTTTNNSSTSSSFVANEAERAAAFNEQRDATAGAFDNQIGNLAGALQSGLELLQLLTDQQISGVNDQEQLATDNVNRQKREGLSSIDQNLAGLLQSLAAGAQAVRTEQGAVSDEIAATGQRARGAIEASDARLRQLGGGDELAAATQEALSRNTQLQGVDDGLARRLASVAEQDFNRRQVGAEATHAAARNDLSNNAALMLAQIVAAATQQRNDINTTSAATRFELDQDYARRTIEAQTQRDLAAAQRHIPEPVRVTNSSSSSTSTSSGGGTSSLLPSQQIQLDQAMRSIDGILNPQAAPSASDQLGETLASLQLEALNSGDLAAAEQLGNIR